MKLSAIVFTSALVLLTAFPAMGDEESLAPGAGVLLVRQAASVSKFTLLHRAVELSTLDDAQKSNFSALLDPFIESQQKLISDATAHHENSEKNQKSAEEAMKITGPKVRAMLAETDPQTLAKAMKAAAFESSVFTTTWPTEKQNDPLPDLINATGVDETTAAAIQKVREDYTFHAKVDLTDDQSRAAIAAIDTQIKPLFWKAETIGIGLRSAAKARALLTEEQQKKWDAAILAMASKPE